MSFSDILVKIDDFVWGLPLIVAIMAVGLFLTFRLRLLQVFHLPKALKFMIKNEEDGEGEVSSFGALCTALSATVGTGNIVGVATALVIGGPGALFWMVVAAFFGMATKYAEGFLAVKYRTIDSSGKVLGGPFHYIEAGIKERYGADKKSLTAKVSKILAVMFAIFGLCVGLMGIGTFTQVNGITSAMNECIPSPVAFNIDAEHAITYTTIIVGAIVTVLVALVVIGGLKRIAKVAEVIVPFMIVAYVGTCLLLLVCNYDKILPSLALIVKSAFSTTAIFGGATASMFVAMQKGVARGIFSNESGLGSAPIAAAAAKTKEPARQGLVCMTGTFIDTIIICTMTGLTIVITDTWNIGLDGAAVTLRAFADGLTFLPPVATNVILSVCLAAFAFTTILGWNYYSEKCLQYLVGDRKWAILTFRWLYIVAVLIGPYLTVSEVWTIADIFNGLMALPNLIGLLLLSGIIARETRDYVKRIKNPLAR